MEPKPWYRLKEADLLEKRISELPLSINGAFFAPWIQKLYGELAAKGLSFRPPCFLADEWFCPVGVPAIGIPFYLAHPKLRKWEQKMILEVEGGTKTDFMKLIRHETGHAYSYAYNLYRKKEWRKFFGSASQEYPDTYRPKPYSKSYVIHLDNWYAQSHPDEDFAETFAVWLSHPKWRTRYKNWNAFKKLCYVDKLMSGIALNPPIRIPRFNPREYSGLGMKLKTYYRNKKKLYEEDYPDFYDRDLYRLFTADLQLRSETKAARYLKALRPQILKAVGTWTAEKKYTIDQVLRRLAERCDEIHLYTRRGDTNLDFHVSSYITTLIMTHLFTGQFKRSQ